MMMGRPGMPPSAGPISQGQPPQGMPPSQGMMPQGGQMQMQGFPGAQGQPPPMARPAVPPQGAQGMPGQMQAQQMLAARLRQPQGGLLPISQGMSHQRPY